MEKIGSGSKLALYLCIASAAAAQQPACYSAPETALTIPAAGRAAGFLIDQQPGCTQTASVNKSASDNTNWISLRSDLGAANILAFNVAPNTGAERSGTITGDGITFTIRQAGVADVIPSTGAAVPALAALDQIMSNALKEFGAPGAVLAVTYQGRLVYARGFGYADLSTQELVEPDSLFRVASISKLFTLAAIDKLIQEGAVAPSTSVFGSILTNLSPPAGLSVVDSNWYKITVDELINHQGGFLTTNLDRAFDHGFLTSATGAVGQAMPGDNTVTIRYAMSQPLDYTPGAPPPLCPTCYSSFGYEILGRAIEKLSGQSYENYIRTAIMAPAGVVRTQAGRTLSTQTAPGEAKYYASGSELWADSAYSSAPSPALTTYGAYPYEHMDSFGGMISSSMDLLRFYNYWLNWGVGQGYFGTLPGANSALFTHQTNPGIKYSFLFNYRSDHNRTNTLTCSVAAPCDLQHAVRADLEPVLAGISNWPSGDLFPQYASANPTCAFGVPASVAIDAAAQTANVAVTASGSGCAWTAVSDSPWLVPVGTGTGSAPVNITVQANGTGASRTAAMYAAGHPLTVMQHYTTASFSDVSVNDYYFDAANRMKQLGITAGCGDGSMFCDADEISRWQMAIFLVRAAVGSDNFTSSAAPYFTDVPPSHAGFRWIQKLNELGYTVGCGAGKFCPDETVPRSDMAVFLTRLRYGVGTALNNSNVPWFTDVPATHPQFAAIQKIRDVGITGGCGATTYCPDAPVTRGEMAELIMRAGFNEQLADGTPVLSVLSPVTVARGATTTLQISGLNTNFQQGVTQLAPVAGVTFGNATVSGKGTLSVAVTVSAIAPAGNVSVIARTGAEEAVAVNRLVIR